MNSLCWNCQGIGTSRTVHAFRNYVRHWNPTIVFLMETKEKLKRMEKINFNLGFSNGLIVPSSGWSGGLAFLWSKEVALEIKSFTKKSHRCNHHQIFWSLFLAIHRFYGHPETHMRGESWSLLSYLNNQYSLPWFCCGDFNEIMSYDEKLGGRQRT